MEQLFNKISVSAICLCGICIKMMEENTGANLSYKRMTPVFFVCKEQSSRMKSQLIKKDSAANRQSVRPIKRKDKKVVAFISGIKPRKRKSPTHKLYVGLFQWRKRWDSNPRAREGYLISSFIKCVPRSVSFVSVSASFVLGAKPHKYWLFHVETPRKPVISGKFE